MMKKCVSIDSTLDWRLRLYMRTRNVQNYSSVVNLALAQFFSRIEKSAHKKTQGTRRSR